MPKLVKLIDDLRADLGDPKLPFIACTIGEFSDKGNNPNSVATN